MHPQSVMLVFMLGITFCMNTAFTQAQLEICPDLVSLLVPQLIFRAQVAELPRIEVRRCGSNESLKIMCWSRNARDPDLVIDTTDFTIVQSVMSGRIAVIETTGGPRNRLFVIEYNSGGPKLAMKHVSKTQAEIEARYGELRISVEDSGTGKIKRFKFPTR